MLLSVRANSSFVDISRNRRLRSLDGSFPSVVALNAIFFNDNGLQANHGQGHPSGFRMDTSVFSKLRQLFAGIEIAGNVPYVGEQDRNKTGVDALKAAYLQELNTFGPGNNASIGTSAISNALAKANAAEEASKSYALLNMTGCFPSLETIDSTLSSPADSSLRCTGNSVRIDFHGAFPALAFAQGGVSIRTNQRLVSLQNAFGALKHTPGDIDISNNSQLSTIEDAFAKLERVGSNIVLANNDNLATAAGAFGSLLWVANDVRVCKNSNLKQVPLTFCGKLDRIGGPLLVEENARLAVMSGCFPSLRSVYGKLYIINNNNLAVMAGAFPALELIGDSDVIPTNVNDIDNNDYNPSSGGFYGPSDPTVTQNYPTCA